MVNSWKKLSKYRITQLLRTVQQKMQLSLKMATKIFYIFTLILAFSSISTEGCSTGKGRIMCSSKTSCNSTIAEKDVKANLLSPITTIVVPAIYSAVFLFGLPANGIAFWVLAFKIKKKPSTFLLLNLAICDLLFMLALPFKITYHLLGNNWIFGEALCRVATGFFYGNMYCSVLFLLGISIDRYMALVHPFAAKGFRRWRICIIISVGFWLVAGAGMIPFFFVPQTKTFEDPRIITCHEVWAACHGYEWYTSYFLGLVILGFAIPLIIISFCYLSILIALLRKKESHKHVIRLLIMVFLNFILCFTPSNVLLLLHYLENNWEGHNKLYLWYMLALSLTSFNSCIDPFIYYYSSQEFWTTVKDTFCCDKEKNSRISGSTQKLKLTASLDSKEIIKAEA
ncbi:proteinase-activated receptor 3-like [Bombina bombina]|uniref:proteinase-activated receptor 3-like n=1 Tax=Bombina bombina TaxID=8345 RepID=UPI00235AF498|nr:proteinase-activated receptor 3-like [Bombina bombina]